MTVARSGTDSAPRPVRLRVCVRGAVQGVGFRPFVFRLAADLGLTGWVNNSLQGVRLEVEGPREKLETFLLNLETERPPRSSIQSLEASWLDANGYAGFEIRESEGAGSKTALILPDIATCDDCRREIFDPANRRFRYPFTNCTNCGPRFSIIEALPYDRRNTSMKVFPMCRLCEAEYNDPRDRRFHAQPNACPACGPHLELWSGVSKPVSQPGDPALLGAAEAIRRGAIVAVKGLGGFHLLADARNDEAVRRLRDRKHREEKPLALMFPTLEAVKEYCDVTPREERLLVAPEAPIVLLRRRAKPRALAAPPLSPAIAPGNPWLGIMLPYTPLHHLLLAELGSPVIATSGNVSDEPICIDENEAVERLAGIADLFLVHNRRIVRPVDDSIVRLTQQREQVLRRARGYAPLPIELRSQTAAEPNILAVGAHLKNTVAFGLGSQVFISQHIGDLETVKAYENFARIIADFRRLYEQEPEVIAADGHPDYLSTKFARESRCTMITVQHHLAHVLACMAENDLEPPVLGVAWDGTGYGLDGTIWGGEFFVVTETSASRVACLRRFRLPGGETAIKEPRRSALGLLYEMYGSSAFSLQVPLLAAFRPDELAGLQSMLVSKTNSPITSSIGRLFDAVASLAGIRQQNRFEGQAAMELEFALDSSGAAAAYPFDIVPSATGDELKFILDWGPMLTQLLDDTKTGEALDVISAKFHHGLVESIVHVTKQMKLERVALSGGCFQNHYLIERTVQRLEQEGFRPYWHQRVPPNDGGISLGQIVGARRAIARKDELRRSCESQLVFF